MIHSESILDYTNHKCKTSLNITVKMKNSSYKLQKIAQPLLTTHMDTDT